MSDIPQKHSPPSPMLQPPPECKLFFGRFGMRAGWSLLIFVPLAVLVTYTGGSIGLALSGQMQSVIEARLAHMPVHIDFFPSMAIGQDGVAFLVLLLFTWFLSNVEHRRFAAFGIARTRMTDFIPGAVVGMATMSLLVFLLRHFGWLVFDGRREFGLAAFLWGAKWLFAFLLVGFCEEYTFRGYIQFTLMRGVWGLAEMLSPTNPRPFAFWISATFWSMLFGILHHTNPGETLFGLVSVAAAGITLAYGLWRTGSLWWGIGLHTTWDWAQSFVYGVPDSGSTSAGRLFASHPHGNALFSGGSDGPEGSLLVIPTLLLVILIIRFTTRPGVQPSIEQETISLPPESAATIA